LLVALRTGESAQRSREAVSLGIRTDRSVVFIQRLKTADVLAAKR
jgi:DNA-binding IclR family transcriptional regulator